MISFGGAHAPRVSSSAPSPKTFFVLRDFGNRTFGEAPKAAREARALPITGDLPFLSLGERTEVRVKI